MLRRVIARVMRSRVFVGFAGLATGTAATTLIGWWFFVPVHVLWRETVEQRRALMLATIPRTTTRGRFEEAWHKIHDLWLVIHTGHRSLREAWTIEAPPSWRISGPDVLYPGEMYTVVGLPQHRADWIEGGGDPDELNEAIETIDLFHRELGIRRLLDEFARAPIGLHASEFMHTSSWPGEARRTARVIRFELGLAVERRDPDAWSRSIDHAIALDRVLAFSPDTLLEMTRSATYELHAKFIRDVIITPGFNGEPWLEAAERFSQSTAQVPDWMPEVYDTDLTSAMHTDVKVTRHRVFMGRLALSRGRFFLGDTPLERFDSTRRLRDFIGETPLFLGVNPDFIGGTQPPESVMGYLSLYPSTQDLVFRDTAFNRGLEATIAVLRYRRDNDQLPETLLDAIDPPPIDPYSLEPILYRIDANAPAGFVVYSTGWDARDDGGTGEAGPPDPSSPWTMSPTRWLVDDLPLDLMIVPDPDELETDTP